MIRSNTRIVSEVSGTLEKGEIHTSHNVSIDVNFASGIKNTQFVF